MPLSVTERAAEVLNQTLQSVEHEPKQVLRLVPQAGGLGLALDQPHDGDQTIEYQGTTIMVLEPEIGEQLTGSTLDVAEEATGGRLTLRS